MTLSRRVAWCMGALVAAFSAFALALAVVPMHVAFQHAAVSCGTAVHPTRDPFDALFCGPTAGHRVWVASAFGVLLAGLAFAVLGVKGRRARWIWAAGYAVVAVGGLVALAAVADPTTTPFVAF